MNKFFTIVRHTLKMKNIARLIAINPCTVQAGKKLSPIKL